MRWTLFPALISLATTGTAWGASEIPAGRFVEVAADDSGGHYYSQVIFAPTVKGLVSWGTRVHGPPMRAHETQIYLPAENRWIDAWPREKAAEWEGNFRNWGDWEICAPAGRFYERDGIPLPRPNSTFYQCAWDDHNGRVVYYVGSMTFSFEPRERRWTLIHDRNVTAQPPALLLWSSLCYDPVNRQILLFGGGGINAPDGRPHTWALDVTTDTWSRLSLEVEPPARCNARMVYDKGNKAIILFGGDGQDRGLADTWIFDVTRQEWRERRPTRGPHPRASHCMAYLERSGLILLVGGNAVAPWREQKRLSHQVWVYDPAANTWTPLAVEVPAAEWASMEAVPGTDEVILVTAKRGTHERRTYRFRYERSIPIADHEGVPPGTVAWKTTRRTAWYEEAPPADRDAHAALLATLPANRWIEVTPPRSTAGRTWGTAIFDTHRGVAMKWGGGHSGYQGTDMAFYEVAANHFSIDRTPAFTPDPFDRWARRPAGRTFFNQPWARHMRHTCAYDPVRRVGVFTDAGGSLWYEREPDAAVKHTWLYDPAERRWLEPIPQPFPGGGSVSPIAIPTPRGVLVYQHDASNTWEDNGRLYRFVGTPGEHATWGWEEIPIHGAARPFQREHMTIVYDTTHDRLIFLSHDRETKEPGLWFFNMAERSWAPNPHPAPGGVSTREAVYLPEADAVLAYGPARKDDPIWTRVYLCAENRWVPLEIETPRYLVHEVALVYDPGRRLAVLLWPPAFERDLRPHLFRLDVDAIPDVKPKKKGEESSDRNTEGTARDGTFDPFAETWAHVSPTSAVVYWQCGADARRTERTGTGYVEYGPTDRYGRQTAAFGLPPVCKEVPAPVRVFQHPSWSQFHRLTDLETGTPVHYRLVHVAPDGTVRKSGDNVLTPRARAGSITLPGEWTGPPYRLDRRNARYVLTADVQADGSAFEIAADGITLDLDGHRVVYGRAAKDNVHGVVARGRRDVKILNGSIEEGPGPGRRRLPVFCQGCRQVEVAGLSVTYHGRDGQGILFSWQGEGSEVHHNTVYDRGTETTSRHQQIAAVHFSPAVGSHGATVHHTIVLRSRQTGIQFGASEQAAREGTVQTENVAVYNNMVYLGSCMTNSMGVSATGAVKSFELRNNRVLGRGEMPECVFVGTGASHGTVRGNYTYARSTGKVSREYGATSSLSSALRLCWGPHHIDVFDNTFVTSSGETDGFQGNARCIWAACSDPRQPEWRTSGEIHIHDNDIAALRDGPDGAYARAITVCGHHEASCRGLVFRNNRVATNADCVVLSESYGCGSSDTRFIGNTFVKAGEGFTWLRCGYWDKPTTGTTFIDSRFEGGASADLVCFEGTARRDFSVGWTLRVKTAPGGEVVIVDAQGSEAFRGRADEDGVCRAALLQYRRMPEGRTPLTPHRLTVRLDGRTAETSVTMDRAREVEIRPTGSPRARASGRAPRS